MYNRKEEQVETNNVNKKKTINRFIFAGIILLFAITRLWKLNLLPYGLHYDEAGMAYDAWCLANYGTDRFLKSWPVYLNAFGGGQSSMYAFLCAALFRLFGYSPWLVRLPSVVFSLMTLYFGGKIAGRFFTGHPYLPLAVSGLVTICPYFILASRLGLDCNLMLGMSTVFLYAFMVALDKHRSGYYIICGITGGLLLYTYVLSYIVLPLFLLLCLLYFIWVRKFSFKNWFAMAVPMGLLAFPLILVQIINAFNLEEMRLGIFTITKLEIYRIGELGRFQFSHFLQALSSIFIGDTLAYNSIPGFFNLYLITIPLFILGLINLIYKFILSLKKREFNLACFPLFWFFTMLFFESHMLSNCNTINGSFLVTILISVEGIRVICHMKRILPLAAALCFIAVYAVCFLRFGIYYYGGAYEQEYNDTLPYFDITVPKAVDFIEENDFLKQRPVYMSQPPIYYALGALISPRRFSVLRDGSTSYQNYYYNALPEINENFVFIVRNKFQEYCNSLRSQGFFEIQYDGYSLFYKE